MRRSGVASITVSINKILSLFSSAFSLRYFNARAFLVSISLIDVSFDLFEDEVVCPYEEDDDEVSEDEGEYELVADIHV